MPQRLSQVDLRNIIARVGATSSSTTSTSTTIKGTITINVPYPGRLSHEDVVSVSDVLSTHKVFLSLGAHDDADENHEAGLNILSVGGKAGTGTITVNVSFGELTAGPIKFNYMAV